MAYSIRTKHFLNYIGHATNQEYEKQIYVKNKVGTHPQSHSSSKIKLQNSKKSLRRRNQGCFKNTPELT